jgi:hypothetical protein
MPSPRRTRFASIEQPYPGLRPFDLKDSFLFFGREQHTQELLDRLSRNRFLAVVGTSGSGKSSLVRAGLMPALFRGYLVGASSRWRIAIMRPGSGPLDQMAGALAAKDALAVDPAQLRATLEASSLGFVSAVKNAQLGPGESLLLVVDQFEEIFRFASERRSSDSTGEALLFVTSLLEAVDQFDAPIYVVLTMRTDFLGDCTLFPGLPEALNRSQYLIPRLSREQRRDAIERPVEIAGAEIAPRLVQQILNDMGDDPDQLPVMQHALARMYRLWKQKGAGAPLDLDDYEAAGTVANALDDHAKSIYQALPADKDREWTRKLFHCLTKRERGRDVRRPARLDRLFGVVGADDPASRDAVLRVLDVFAREENSLLFLTPGDRSEDRIADISHESLIRKWRQLSAWVKDEAESTEWFSDLVRDTARQARGEADYWVNPELSWVLTRRAQDSWTAAWAEQSVGTDARGFAAVETFLEGSRAKEASRKRHRRLVYAGIAVMLTLGLVAADQFHHARDAEAELAKLSVEQQNDKAKLDDLERQRALATGDQRKQLDANIEAVKNSFIKSLQQENVDLKSRVSSLSQQPKAGDVDSLNRRISELAPKAQQYDTLKSQYDEMYKQLGQVESMKKERDQFKMERDNYSLQLAKARPPSLDTSAKTGSTASVSPTGSTGSPGPANGGSLGPTGFGPVSPGSSTGSEKPPVAPSPGTPVGNPAATLAEAMAPIFSVKLENDSAVVFGVGGLIFLLQHMGVGVSATVFVLAGTPAPGAAIQPYLHNKDASVRYVAAFNAAPALKACKGGSANVGGYTVWCFKIEQDQVNKKKHKAQHLGSVTADRRFELFGVDYNWKANGASSVEVEIRPAK